MSTRTNKQKQPRFAAGLMEKQKCVMKTHHKDRRFIDATPNSREKSKRFADDRKTI